MLPIYKKLNNPVVFCLRPNFPDRLGGKVPNPLLTPRDAVNISGLIWSNSSNLGRIFFSPFYLPPKQYWGRLLRDTHVLHTLLTNNKELQSLSWAEIRLLPRLFPELVLSSAGDFFCFWLLLFPTKYRQLHLIIQINRNIPINNTECDLSSLFNKHGGILHSKPQFTWEWHTWWITTLIMDQTTTAQRSGFRTETCTQICSSNLLVFEFRLQLNKALKHALSSSSQVTSPKAI